MVLQFVLYSLALSAAALLSGSVPLLFEKKGFRTDILLSFSAGIMLGAAFAQMIPEAIHIGHGNFWPLSFVLVGALTMFLLERFVITHICEEPEEGCEVHDHESLGIAAFLGLSVHTLFDGVALGSSFMAGIGLAVFAAIVAHKIPSSLALGTILVHAGYRRRTILLLLTAFALTVPLGSGIYFLIDRHLDFEHLTAWVLAFSAGTFLYLSLADLLPQVHKKSGLRWPALAALFLGVVAMYAVRLVGHHHH